MAIDRRRLLVGLAGCAVCPALPTPSHADADRSVYVSARRDGNGAFRVGGFTGDGRPVFDLPLPARGHAIAVHPQDAVAVLFARRPGTFALVIDLAGGRVIREVRSPEDRHFYGHGVFGPDGRLLYAPENDFEAGHGVIGVYDGGAGYARVGELPSHGIGPHDVRLLSDGETLVVANGGIRTHPDLPRMKLNLQTMAPSLAYVDRRDGRPRRLVPLPAHLHLLGIRHLAVGAGDTVGVAMQYEGPAGDRVPLVGCHRGDGPLRLLEGPVQVVAAMKQYGGSAAFDRDGRILAVSAPRGNLVTFWDVARGAFLSAVPVPDGCGVAPGPHPGTFLVSSGLGGAVTADARTGRARHLGSAFLAESRWDNHLVSVRAG